ncbi:MAG: hypothetical protein AAF639_01070 [Chloroflexota bacterium]
MDKRSTNIVKLSLLTLPLVLVLLAACGRDRPTPDAPEPATATPVLAAISLVDAPLLSSDHLAQGFAWHCDHPPEASLECTATPQSITLDVTANASTYARWSLNWRESLADSTLSGPLLTGDETLTLAIRRKGQLSPNLYLVTADGQRLHLNLNAYGLNEGQENLLQTLHIPLQEFVDEEGNRLVYNAIEEVQIAFEWADMDGELMIQDFRFASVWQESVMVSDESKELAATLQIPDDFVIEPMVDGVREMTQIIFATDGSMLVSQQRGRVWSYQDSDDDGHYDQRHLHTTGFTEIVGLLYDPIDDAVWIGGRGKLYRVQDTDANGVADTYEVRLTDLPWGRHQNNGLVWNPDPDPFTGEEGHHWIYFGLGSTEDLEDGGPLNSTVLRFPRNSTAGQDDLEVVSRGNRNAYMLTWGQVPVDLSQPDGDWAWQLFAGENGPDFNDAPDEVNHIRWQHHYGFPEQFGLVEDGQVDGEPYSGPVYPVTAHASASGVAYVNNPDWPETYRTLYVSLFGQVFGTEIAGHKVQRVTLSAEETSTGTTYRGEPDDFVLGVDRPLPMMVGPQGNLWFGDYATGVIYRVSYR